MHFSRVCSIPIMKVPFSIILELCVASVCEWLGCFLLFYLFEIHQSTLCSEWILLFDTEWRIMTYEPLGEEKRKGIYVIRWKAFLGRLCSGKIFLLISFTSIRGMALKCYLFKVWKPHAFLMKINPSFGDRSYSKHL